jgi:hypothetical protein
VFIISLQMRQAMNRAGSTGPYRCLIRAKDFRIETYNGYSQRRILSKGLDDLVGCDTRGIRQRISEGAGAD